MIKLDGYYYAVAADGHDETFGYPRRVETTLAGKTLVVTGTTKPREWKYTLLLDDENRSDATGRTLEAGWGNRLTLLASLAKVSTATTHLEFWDERTDMDDPQTCLVVFANPFLSFKPIGQVLASAKYRVEVNLVEVLT